MTYRVMQQGFKMVETPITFVDQRLGTPKSRTKLSSKLSRICCGHASISNLLDAIPKVAVRRFGAHEIAPQGQEVERAAPPRTVGQPGGETAIRM